MSKIDEEVKLGKLLGKGAYGDVYKVFNKDLAIKLIESGDEGLNELGELNNLKRFDHPNILKCEGFTLTDDELGLVIPLATSDMTHVKMADIPTIIEWFYQIISAIHFLHKNNFYHCDIKPANILLIDGKAVLADLGLVGKKNVNTNDVCQSLMSPQLMYRREKKLSLFIKNKQIFKEPSNEYQDDIWALGLTFYLMIPGVHDRIGTTSLAYDLFMKHREDVLLKSGVPPQFIPLLLILLDPVPEKRSLNLLSLLSLELFIHKVKFIDGDMTIVDNPRPIIFDDVVKNEVSKYLALIVMKLPREADINIQACDLFFRTYEFFRSTIINIGDHRNWITAIVLIILKINNKSNLITFDVSDDVEECEKNIVGWTNGNLSRLIVSDFIEPDKYQTFIDWLIENPDRYEQCSISKLTQIINSL